MFERFTKQARDTVLRVRLEALDDPTGHIGTEHLLLALLSPDAGIAYAVLTEAGIDAQLVRREAQRLAATPPEPLGPLGQFGDDDAAALKSIGIDLSAVMGRIEETFGKDALAAAGSTPRRGLRRRRSGSSFSPQAKKVMEMALREALALHHNYIGTEHLLLGLAREGHGAAATILTQAGLTSDELRRRVQARLSDAA